MRRADRLFDIIQVLRLARTPADAAAIATEWKLASRPCHADIAHLAGPPVPMKAPPRRR